MELVRRNNQVKLFSIKYFEVFYICLQRIKV